MTDFNIGDDVWFVCIDGEIWVLAKGVIKEFPFGKNHCYYPIAIVTNKKMKTEFHTSTYFKTQTEAINIMSRYVQEMNEFEDSKEKS